MSLPARVALDARAKLNLGLCVGPRRTDGFHDLVTVFQSVALADTLTAERARAGVTLRVRHESPPLHGRGARAARPRRDPIPAGADNLVLRAARLVAERLALPGGARFTLVKRIPAQAGLGGGSADAAAAIAAMLALHGRRLPRAARLALGAELGSDVPFALLGGTALGEGRGERLTRVRLARPFRAVLVVPAWRVSTAAAFARIDRARYRLTEWGQASRFATTVRLRGVVSPRTSALGNTFQQVLGDHQEAFESLCERLRAAGLNTPRLTGSGSGVFAMIPDGRSIPEVAGRFSGTEPLMAVRSVGAGLRLHTQP